MVSFGGANAAKASRSGALDAGFGVKSDQKAENQPFVIDIELGESFSRLTVRAKSFPGYPGYAALQWITASNPECKKYISEKGEFATWRVTPASAYHALAERARNDPLLALEDKVAQLRERLRCEIEAGEKRLRRAEDEAKAANVALPRRRRRRRRRRRAPRRSN